MIQLGNPFIGQEEIDSVQELLTGGHLSIGDIVESFETEFASFTNRAGGAAVCSGSMALQLTLQVIDLDPGDGVVVSPYNCGALLYETLRRDLIPIFADIDPETCSLDPQTVREAVSDATVPAEAMILTHLYGLPGDLDEITDVAEELDLTIINDFAQAPGSRYRNKQIGSLGEIGICSFGATKNITTAEGGMVVSDEESVLSRLRELRSNTSSDSSEASWSVRMNDIEAAIGREQLRRYDSILSKKRSIAAIYRDQLPLELCLQPEFPDRMDVYHGFPLTHPERDSLAEHLAADEIMTGTAYDTPLYEYDVYSHSIDSTAYPHTERISSEVILLPIHANMTTEKAKTVTESINQFL